MDRLEHTLDRVGLYYFEVLNTHVAWSISSTWKGAHKFTLAKFMLFPRFLSEARPCREHSSNQVPHNSHYELDEAGDSRIDEMDPFVDQLP